jgi:ATP-dependent exoDNAse (exonuclease V) alpha subunit
MAKIYLLVTAFIFLVLFTFGLAVVASGRADITGSAVLVDSISKTFDTAIKSSRIYLFLSIIAVAALLNAGYQIVKAPAKMQRLLATAKKHLEEGAIDKAVQVYEETRLLYENMKPEEKLRNYNDLIEIYNNLMWHYRAKEAQKLAEKYSKGTLSDEELRRLELLLQSY